MKRNNNCDMILINCEKKGVRLPVAPKIVNINNNLTLTSDYTLTCEELLGGLINIISADNTHNLLLPNAEDVVSFIVELHNINYKCDLDKKLFIGYSFELLLRNNTLDQILVPPAGIQLIGYDGIETHYNYLIKFVITGVDSIDLYIISRLAGSV